MLPPSSPSFPAVRKKFSGGGAIIALSLASTLLLSAAPGEITGRQQLQGHLPASIAASRLVEPMLRETRLKLAIGLPLRNQGELETLLGQISDPESSNFHKFLTSAQFAEQFGPTERDYQTVIEFATAHGLTVTATHPNRMILDVSGAVPEIERALHVKMQTRWTSARGNFFTPDREPSLDLEVDVLHISGLDNFVLPRPMGLKTAPVPESKTLVTGSGPSGLFIGNDFRSAYAPGVTLTGAKQTVGLFELDGFYASDVAANFATAGIPAIPVRTVLLDGMSGNPGGANVEVTLDIMMAAYMAPGLSSVIVYEGSNWDDVLNRMATDNLAQQLSSSWCFSPIDATTEQIFKQYIAQGQSLFQASGDSGAYPGWIFTPSDNPNLTVVGGTSLQTSGLGGPWQSESTWSGSGGGKSTAYPIPSYQQGLSMAANHGSTTMRNIPDVALTADIQMFLIYNNGQSSAIGGTSAAAPLWAGFTALVNQQAAANGKPRVGFINPLVYAIGKGTSYGTDFHDIASGSNGLPSVAGYDLTTGWGTPAGQPLINDLTGLVGQPYFTLSAAPATLSIQPGKAATATITVGAQNGFTGSVKLTVAGLPTGVTALLSPASTAGTSVLTLTAAASAASSTTLVTVSGVSGTLTTTTTLSLAITSPNFVISSSATSFGILLGTNASSTITITPQNGFSGAVTLASTGLPTGVTAAFSPVSTATSSILTLTVSATAPAWTGTVTVTGVSGGLTRTTAIGLTVVLPAANSTLVNLSSVANVGAIVADGSTFANPLSVDTKGASFSANLLRPTQVFNGTTLYFGPANTLNGVSGKVVPIPTGNYSTLSFLGAGMNGNQPAQSFVVTYSDGTTTKFAQSISDWFTPQSYPGESKVLTMAYRDNSNGSKDSRTFVLYGYTLALNGAKQVSSITLPNNRNVVVLALSLTASVPQGTPAIVSMSAAFDTTGIATDGRPFTSSGLDGVGYAYSANLLGATRTIAGVPFNFGPADGPDALSGNGKPIALPAGKFSKLLILGTAVNGSQTAQTFKVTYSDATTATLSQNMSDWFKPQNNPGETQAVVMTQRNNSKGARDNGPYYVYGYSLALNNTKTVTSITTPTNKNVRVLALTLVP